MAAKLRRWLREAAVFLALLIAIMVVMDVWRAPQAPPAFAATPLHTLTGESTTLATLSEERPVLLYFWASWCGVCRFTTPAVARLAAEGENVMTVALRSGDDAEVARWLARNVAAPLVKYIDKVLVADRVSAPKVTVLVGHDSNIASLLTALDFKPYQLHDQ